MAALVAASAQTVGPSVVAGQAQILTAGDTTVVTQSTSKAIINWQSFSVASGSTLQFAQPGASAITLNRVTGGAASSINGALLANGQVWILNSNGVLFGQGASIHVGGLLATTSDIADNDFVSGNYRFTTGGSGSIVNNGTIKAARGGSVVLSAPTVINNGLVQATAGHVVLAGTDTFTVDFSGDHLLSYAVGASSQTGTVMNSGIIKAAGGQVLLTARAAAGVADGVINNTGMVEATSVRKGETGEIVLDAGDGTAETSGTLDASGKAAGATGGSVQVLGQTVAVADGARIDVSGDAGGGTALIGGNFKGAGPQANAQTTTVGKAAINANAITSGNGGKVAVYSDGTTSITASISAKGSAGGAGGDVETSGHFLYFDGITVNAGPGGNWLLDPYNLTVSSSATTATQSPTGTFTSNASGNTVLNTDINSALNAGTSVVLQTSGTLGDGQGNGDITVSAPITMTGAGAASLTLKAGGSIIVNAAIGSTGGALGVTLDANTLGGGGYVNINSNITTNGGNLIVGGGANPLTGAAVGTAAFIYGVLVNVPLSTGGGNITINGTGYGGGAGNGNYGVYVFQSVATSGGAITITGTGGNTSGSGNYGIDQNSTITATGAGAITLMGTGGGTGSGEIGYYTNANITAAAGNISITGAGSPTGTGSGSHGIEIDASSSISTGSTGLIALNGTGTGNGSGGNTYGVFFNGGSSGISAVNGAISITGTNSSTGAASGNDGVFSNNATITSNGTGGITINGTAGGTAAGGADYGVSLQGTTALQSSSGGGITITGQGGDSLGIGTNNFGVFVGEPISSSGGAVSITGTGGASTNNGNTGIVVNNTITTTGTGAITLNGTGGGVSTSASDIGVQILAAITGSGGSAISITGTGGSTSGSYNSGIYQTAALVNYQSGVGGNITLNGTGGGTGSNEIGYFTSANVTAGNASASVNGNISITGAGSAAAAGSFNYGIQIQSASTIYTAGTGTITLAGTASGGTGGGIFGVFLNAGAIAAVNGLISVTGTSNAYSSATMDNGVQIAGTITSSGTGGVTVNGTGGGTGGAGADYGVYLAIANAIQTPGNAAVSLTGSGGDIGGLGTLNAGVYIGGALNVGRNISITGTGGAQGGAINPGITLPYGITSGGGTITLNSTGTVTGNGALSASGLELLGTGGTYLLTSTSSVVGTLSGNTGSVTYTQAGPLNIGPAGSTNGLTTTGAITLTAAGYVTQSFGIAATDLTITTTGSGSTISLNDLGGGADNGNQISGTARFNSASNVAYNSSYSSGPTVIGNSLINGNLTVNAGSHAVGINDASGSLSVTGNTVLFGGSFSQTIPIATQNLTVTAGNGNITLTGGNQVTGIVEMFANSAGANGVFTNSVSTLLGNSSIGNSLTVMSGGTLTLQDSSPTGISASAVSLQAASGISQSTTSPNIAAGSLSALSAGGSVTLASTNNAISGTVTLGSAPTGSIAFTNSVATTLGAVSGLGATYSPVAGGSVTITSPNGGITLTGLVQMSGATQLISSSGGITESVTGQIISGSLSVQSAGTAGISLAQPFNIVTGSVSLIGPIGSANVSFANSVSTSLSSSSAGGTLTVASAGNLTLLPSTILASQAGIGSTGVVLSATGAFINNSGSSALYLPNGARFLIYSQNPGGDAFGGLNSSNTAVWGTSYPTPVSASGSRYVFAFQPVITVAAGNLSKTYGVDVTASLVGDYTISGVQAGVANAFLGDTAAAIYGGTISLASAGAAAGAGVSAAPYFIQINAANFHVGGGYGLAVIGGATLTVNPATLTYNAAAGSRAYGAANPAYSGTVTGFVNGDTQASATTGTLAFTSPTTTASSVGSYAINGAGLSANNYTFVQAAGNAMALTINPATLTYAATATSRLYGQANAAFGGLVNGFVNGDTQASATSGSLAFTSAATAASDVGSYAINGSGLIASKNYVLVQAASNATALTINPATLTLALTGTVSKIFDGTTTATLSASNYAALSGIFGTDSVALSSDPTTGVYDTAAIGTGKTVSVSGIALSGAKAADYIIAGSVSGAVGVITAPATMTATTATATPAASASTFDTLFNATSVSGVPILAGFTTALITSTTPVSTPQQPPPTGPQVTIPITVVSLSTALGDMPSQDGNQPSDAPLSSDQTTSYVAQSLDGGPPPNRNGSHGADGAVIPHFLTARAARPVAPFNPRDLPSWGNAVLWN
jgi:filamentous hemagglutinin family protein